MILHLRRLRQYDTRIYDTPLQIYITISTGGIIYPPISLYEAAHMSYATLSINYNNNIEDRLTTLNGTILVEQL